MHRISIRWLTTLTAIAAVAAIVSADPGGLFSRLQDDGRNLDPRTIATVRRDLETRAARTGARISYKESLIDELIAGRSTLAQVSEEFLRMNEEEPGFLKVLSHKYPAPSDDETSALNVIDYVVQRA